MADIRFYHLLSQPLGQALPDLLSKALSQGHRLVIKAPDVETVKGLSAHLWVCRRDDIFPHGTSEDGPQNGMPAYQPIWLTAGNENPNNAKTLILVQGAEQADITPYSLVCEMLDGNQEDQVAAARSRYKAYKEAGHTVTYWQQKQAGGWEQKA